MPFGFLSSAGIALIFGRCGAGDTAQFGGAAAGMAAEGCRKAAGVLVPHAVGNLGHRKVAAAQQIGGGVHPQPPQIAGHWYAVQRLKADLQRALGQVEPRGQLGQRDVAALVGQQVIVGLAGMLQLQAVK